MKRSEINQAIKDAQALMKEFKFYLPEWADWTPEDWKIKGHECDEIRRNALGWDVTDFSKGNFKDEGLTLVTMRNGNPERDDQT
jgi:D-lyxose ketol-isomerase